MYGNDVVQLSEEEIKDSAVIASFKGGQLLRKNSTIYFRHPSQSKLYQYPAGLVDYVTEWGKADLRLPDVWKEIVFSDDGRRVRPVSCRFSDGTSSDYCFLLLTHFPPGANFFLDGYKPTWHYLNHIEEMTPSPRAVNDDVWVAMKEMERQNKVLHEKIMKLRGNLLENPEYDLLIKNAPRDVVVCDLNGALFKFNEIQQLVYDPGVDPLTFQLINNPTDSQLKNARQLSMGQDPNADRKEPRPPALHIYIVADAESAIDNKFLFNGL